MYSVCIIKQSLSLSVYVTAIRVVTSCASIVLATLFLMTDLTSLYLRELIPLYCGLPPWLRFFGISTAGVFVDVILHALHTRAIHIGCVSIISIIYYTIAR